MMQLVNLTTLKILNDVIFQWKPCDRLSGKSTCITVHAISLNNQNLSFKILSCYIVLRLIRRHRLSRAIIPIFIVMYSLPWFILVLSFS